MRTATCTLLAMMIGLAGCEAIERLDLPAGGPAPAVGPVKLERITVSQLPAGPQQFSCGIVVSGQRDESDQMVATIQAVGHARQVIVAGEADFYALSHRPDVVVMHDRYSDLLDTIRIYRFATSGVTERTFSHGQRGQQFAVRRYVDFTLAGERIAVTEEFSPGVGSASPPVRRQYALPLD